MYDYLFLTHSLVKTWFNYDFAFEIMMNCRISGRSMRLQQLLTYLMVVILNSGRKQSYTYFLRSIGFFLLSSINKGYIYIISIFWMMHMYILGALRVALELRPSIIYCSGTICSSHLTFVRSNTCKNAHENKSKMGLYLRRGCDIIFL